MSDQQKPSSSIGLFPFMIFEFIPKYQIASQLCILLSYGRISREARPPRESSGYDRSAAQVEGLESFSDQNLLEFVTQC